MLGETKLVFDIIACHGDLLMICFSAVFLRNASPEIYITLTTKLQFHEREKLATFLLCFHWKTCKASHMKTESAVIYLADLIINKPK